MGLASALTTALTGLTAAETQIDVVGNNLANSQTIGFKASEAVFATQFLQTLSLGSSPTSTSGGTSPRQTGLGTQVAAITPDFTQGTIEISSNASDLAIQGEGFFQVKASSGETLFTRNGIFQTNANNQLVTTSGNLLLGFASDSDFNLQRTALVPIEIPLGDKEVAQATQSVGLEGTFTPTGDVADTSAVIESEILGNGDENRADGSAITINPAATTDESVVTTGTSAAGGSLTGGATYQYRFAYVDASGTEAPPSAAVSVTLGGGDDTATLTTLPNHADYSLVNIYRTDAGGSTFKLLTQQTAGGASYVDDGTTATTTTLDSTTINGNYSYLVTYYAAGLEETRPSQLVGPVNISNGRIHLTDLPTPTSTLTPPIAYTDIRIYRNLANDPNTYYRVATVPTGQDYTDYQTDVQIQANPELDLDGPDLTLSTLLVNVTARDGLAYTNPFVQGTLSFAGSKGGRTLQTKQFTVDATTTVGDFISFMSDSTGIQSGGTINPIATSLNTIPGDGGAALTAGGSVKGSKIRIVSNTGVDSAVNIGLAAFTMTSTAGAITSPTLDFSGIQTAKGQSAVTDFVAYDSLGIAVNVRLTAVLESRTGTTTTYRWFADSPDNDDATANDADIAVGTGLVTFDGTGNFVTVNSNTQVSIERRDVPSTDPLVFNLDFSQLTGLASDKASLAASRQDGSPPGTLTSFIIGEDGIIRGVFSNGIARDLAQIQLARFTNASGLEQRGQNLFAEGVNSGLPVQGDPGISGMGSLISGAVELSNTDIGQNLVDLILATTQYRGNTRVVTAAQQLLDELLNLRR